LSGEGLTSSRWRIASPKIGSPPHLIECGDFGIAELFILNLICEKTMLFAATKIYASENACFAS
jgi:hypothetical protein